MTDEQQDDTPEGRAARREQQHRLAIITRLLSSLEPADAHRHLFTYLEQVTWNLRRFNR